MADAHVNALRQLHELNELLRTSLDNALVTTVRLREINQTLREENEGLLSHLRNAGKRIEELEAMVDEARDG